MAFTPWDLARSLTGPVPQAVPVVLTASNAIRVGEPLALTAATGKLVPAPGGADTKPIKYVSQVALASQAADTIIPAYPCLDGVVFRIKMAGSPIVGKRVGLTATDLTGVQGTNRLTTLSLTYGAIFLGIHYCVCLNWLITTAGA